jgi:hypothetical protein
MLDFNWNPKGRSNSALAPAPTTKTMGCENILDASCCGQCAGPYRRSSFVTTTARPLAHVRFEDESGRRAAAKLLTKGEARRLAVNFAKLPDLLRLSAQ